MVEYIFLIVNMFQETVEDVNFNYNIILNVFLLQVLSDLGPITLF
jgi:hypothetical protein